MNQQDVIVVGGGMVGAATALGLAKQGLNVVLLEKKPLASFSQDMPYDLRISAISKASVNLLEELGAWQFIKEMRICPYDGLETWEMDGFETKFSAQDLGITELGYMIENNVVQLGLWETLKTYPNCQQIVGFDEITVTRDQDIWSITIDGEKQVSAPLVVAADGARSLVRSWAGIGLTSWQYRQDCMLIVAKTELPQQSVTWQEFHPSGPRAFLPLLGNQGCVIWYDSPQRIKELQQMPPEKLSQEIIANFPQRLGNVEVEACGSFPLTRQHAQNYFKNGIVLAGDSAHTINPLAGQGVNLGFKDVKALLEVIEKAQSKGENIASDDVLKRYQRKRKPDNLLMQSGMDFFYKTFKTELLPVKALRNLGLFTVNKLTPLKKQALKYAIGL